MNTCISILIKITIINEGFKHYMENALSANGQWENYDATSFWFSSGVTLGYSSILGPINLDFSWVNGANKIRAFIGIGFQLNRSN